MVRVRRGAQRSARQGVRSSGVARDPLPPPAPARRTASARPMPLAAPVMSAAGRAISAAPGAAGGLLSAEGCES